MEIFLISLALIIGFYMLWNIGANDVANAVGTSVGSGAITLKRAIILAAILEFSGAFILGSNVSETIQKGIIDPLLFVDIPNVFVVGMLSSLLATAVWLQIATFFKWPVSTTHAIVGSVMGFGILVGGFHAVQWIEIGKIAMSWVISPTLAGVVAFLFFSFIQKRVLFSFNPLLSTQRLAPFFVFFVLMVFLVSTLIGGIKGLNIELSYYTTLIISTTISLIGAIISFFICNNQTKNAKMSYILAAKHDRRLHSLLKVQKHLIRARLSYRDEQSRGNVNELLTQTDHLIKETKDKAPFQSELASDYRGVEGIFAMLQILTACFVAFAHGSNDVANAIGPVSGIINVVRDPQSLIQATTISIPLLLFGGAGIIIGLATYGYKVIETIGNNITELTPTRGFAAEFAAASTILIASKLGLPISTTHAIVGAVLGVGLARGLSALNFKLIKGIFMSWVITIPSAAVFTVLIYSLFSLFL
ncbi:MAG: Low-affinity inorganic phosphate transporter 1 [Chlamydiia bacterium]|nr:Low-affinity inorganic phosphate transporter 1 [Chlamydiia bacterium]